MHREEVANFVHCWGRLPVFAGLLLAAGCLMVAGAAETEESALRQRVEAMSAAEKQKLARLQARFNALDPTEQARLRRLHQRLENDPQAAQLRLVMRRYHDWLKTLPLYTQAELADLPLEKRIERIKELKRDQFERQFRQLNPEDADGLRRWCETYLSQHKEEFLKNISQSHRQRLAKLSGPQLRQAVVGLVLMRWRTSKPGETPPVAKEELAALRSMLSTHTRKELESRPLTDQLRLIAGWIQQGLYHQWGPRRSGKAIMSAREEQLAHYFEHELTSQQRDRLLGLPGEEMQQQLRRMYYMSRRSATGSTQGRPVPLKMKRFDRLSPKRPKDASPGGPPPPRHPGKIRPDHDDPEHKGLKGPRPKIPHRGPPREEKRPEAPG